MKLNKNFKFYTLIWLFGLAIFNVITFVVPAEIAGINRYKEGLFWVGYALITVTLFGQLLCSYIFLKEDSKKRIFLRFPLLNIGYSMLATSIIVGTLFMVLPILPTWIGIIVCLLLLFFYFLSAVKAIVAAEAVESVEKKIALKTAFIKLLIADADSLRAYAKTPDVKQNAQKVYEVLRYSDPMSDDALQAIEDDIQLNFSSFSSAVKANNADDAAAIAERLLLLINDRNKKCKMLKV